MRNFVNKCCFHVAHNLQSRINYVYWINSLPSASVALKPIKERLGLSAGSVAAQPGNKSKEHWEVDIDYNFRKDDNYAEWLKHCLLLSLDFHNSWNQSRAKESSWADPHQNSGGDQTGEGSKVSVQRWPFSRGSWNQQYENSQGCETSNHQ